MSDYKDPYGREREEGGFFERNCDEAWEQICETFSHPWRLVGRVLLIALVVSLAVGASYLMKIRAPELPNKGEDADKDPNQSQVDEIDYGDGVRPKADGERKSKDFYTVLVLGRDTGGGGNTDTMLLASYDVTNQKATVMSIPRDTMVNVSWDIKRINSVYNFYGGGDKGTQALYKEVAQLVGFEPDYKVIVEWAAVGEIVEAMGGVYYDVPRDMNYDDPYQDLHIHQTKGYCLLSGDDVMQVLRYRHDNDLSYGYADGDLGRIKTQQSLLKAMIEQLLQLKNVAKIGEFAKVVKNNVTSDLTFEEMLWFGKQAVFGGLSVDDVTFVTMPNTAKYAYSRSYPKYPQSYVFPNAQELLTLVNESLSPFTEVFTMSDLDIMSLNSDGSLSSSTGYVEDSKAAATPPVQVDPYTGKITSWPGSETATPDDTQNGEVSGSENGNTGDADDGSIGDDETLTGTDDGSADADTSGSDIVSGNDTDVGESGTSSGDAAADEMPDWLQPAE